ncbi:hypothetical protein PGS_00000350 [Porphyromonas gingivalis A7A1-28]|nr:hypothetical protein PGS_00000350 [Porphyromonas gingivalis A7A1-28]OWR78713.1 hypothetical protein SJDPG4_05065 [Porphyromonas gingivalis SJD4]SJL32112.1 hypothetical protein PGIN_A7A1-28_01608 [Porphyromonas gingivalis]
MDLLLLYGFDNLFVTEATIGTNKSDFFLLKLIERVLKKDWEVVASRGVSRSQPTIGEPKLGLILQVYKSLC